MADASSIAPQLVFQFSKVVPAGIFAALVTLIALIVMLAIMPRRFPMNPLYLVGSAFSINTTTAYISGLVIFLVGGLAYGSFVAASLVGFEALGRHYLWGAGAGLFLLIVTGTTLAYARNLNRAVRAGQVGDPGPFLVRYGKYSVAQLVFAHMLFGAVAGQLYFTFSR